MLLTIDRISKAYGDNQVLNEVSFTLDVGQKIGLVGANGVGKTTLLKIITGQLEADGGTVAIAPGVDVGYLPQVLEAAEDLTLDGLMNRSLGDLRAIENRMRDLEAQMAAPADDLDTLLEEYAHLSETFERRGGYDLDHRIAAVFAGLGIAHLDRSRRMSTISGGEKSRAGLAALLLRAPDLLLLDEPTNHLDFAALEWLETYLRTYRGGLLVVSHDRQFLNQTVRAIVEIDEHTRAARLYTGSYDDYARVKEQERTRWVEDYWKQQEEIWELRKAIKTKARQVGHNRGPRDGDKFLYNFKGEQVAGTISRNLRSLEEKLRRIEEDPIPKPPRQLDINPDFDPQALVSRVPLEVEHLNKRYGERILLHDVSFALYPTSRIVIVGPNGTGKSTLLKIIAGLQSADSGQVSIAASVVLGYLDQEQETLPEGESLFDAYRHGRAGDPEEIKAELLGYGLFTWPDLQKPVAALSVGQKRKLQIARLIARRANLLLLDEPTNHISLDVLEEFERALAAFSGPIIAVSHDRRFIQRFATEVWELQDGKFTFHLGGWEAYHEQMAKSAPTAIPPDAVPEPVMVEIP